MTRKLTAQDLKNFLIEQEKIWRDLSCLEVNIKDDKWDYYNAIEITEDLYDSKTNSILESIVISSYIEE